MQRCRCGGVGPTQGRVAHALQAEVYAYLAPGSGGKERDALQVIPELAEAGGVCLPFVNLTCIPQGFGRLQLLRRRGSAVVGFSFFAWRSVLWGWWLCNTESYLGGQGHTNGRAKCDAFVVVFEVEGKLSNVAGRQGVRAMRQETLEFRVEERVEERLVGEEKNDDPEEINQLGGQIWDIVRNSDRSLHQFLDLGVGETSGGA